MILPDPADLADSLALHEGDLESALEAHGLPVNLDDPAIADLVERARNLERAAVRPQDPTAFDPRPLVNWHATAELAVAFAGENPDYVAVQFDGRPLDTDDGYATTRSAVWLARWMTANPTARILAAEAVEVVR